MRREEEGEVAGALGVFGGERGGKRSVLIFSKCGRRTLPSLCNCRRQIFFFFPSLHAQAAHLATLHIPVNYNLPETWRLQQPPVCRERGEKYHLHCNMCHKGRGFTSVLCVLKSNQSLVVLLFFLLALNMKGR